MSESVVDNPRIMEVPLFLTTTGQVTRRPLGANGEEIDILNTGVLTRIERTIHKITVSMIRCPNGVEDVHPLIRVVKYRAPGPEDTFLPEPGVLSCNNVNLHTEDMPTMALALDLAREYLRHLDHDYPVVAEPVDEDE